MTSPLRTISNVPGIIYDPLKTDVIYAEDMNSIKDHIDDLEATPPGGGSVWLSGVGAPSDANGNDGDYYLRTSNSDVYTKVSGTWGSPILNIKGSQGIQGEQGPAGNNGTDGTDGTDGTNGATWRSGVGAPDNGVGVDGDLYLRTSNSDVYLRSAGTYSVILNIKGAQGIQGEQGPAGNNGADGADGVFPNPTTTEIVLGENAPLALDSALSADGKYSGIVEAGTGGATLAFGDLCYFQASDSRWELVDANLSAGYDKKLGICVLACASDGNATKMLLFGKIRADAKFPTMTIGSPVYMSESAGLIVVTQPVTADVCIRKIGFGNTADELYFCPSTDYITHT
jgi:hypothetical protein